MSAIKVFAKQFSWLALADVWGKGVMFILLTIVARLGTQQLGIYAYILSVVGILSIIGDFGTTGIYIREAKKQPKESLGLLAQFLFLKMIMIALFIVLGGCWLFFSGVGSSEFLYFFLYSLFIIFDSFTSLFLAYVRVNEQFRYEAIVKICTKVVLLTCLGFMALFGYANLYGVFLSYAIAGFIGALAAGASSLSTLVDGFAKGSHRPRIALIKYAFYESFPLGVSGVLWQVYYRIDTLLLRNFKGEITTGYYAASYSVLQLINTVPALGMLVLFPKLVESFQKNPRRYLIQFWKIAGAFFGSGLILGIVTFFCAPIIPLYYGAEYAESAHLLKILSYSIPALYVNTLLSYGLIVIKKAPTLTLVVLMALIVNCGINIIFIPQYGAYAAAWATVVTEYSVAVYIVIFLLFTYRKIVKTLPAD